MMLKKLAAFVTAVIVCSAVFCGCANDKENNSEQTAGDSAAESVEDGGDLSAADGEAADAEAEIPTAKLVIDGSEVETDGLTMLTINGRDIDFDTFRYYYYGTLSDLAQYGITLQALGETEDGFSKLLENVVYNIKQDHVTYALADENGIELDDEDLAQNEETYNGIIEEAGSEENYQQQLAMGYLTDDIVKSMLEQAALYNKTAELFVGDGKYATSKEDFREIVKDPEVYACVRSILIPYACKAEITDEDTKSAYDGYDLSDKLNAKETAFDALSEEEQETVKAESEALAKEVAQKAAGGEDFEELLAEYGWDPGMEARPEGYYMTKDTSFVQEFLDASFELKEGDVTSDPVVSDSYGWFIIKRMPIDMDYVEENIDTMIQDYDLPARQQVYLDTIDNMKVTFSDTYNKLTMDSII